MSWVEAGSSSLRPTRWVSRALSPKKLGSRHRSGSSRSWVKVKTFEEQELIVIGTSKEDRAPVALLARECRGALEYAGTAMVTLDRAPPPGDPPRTGPPSLPARVVRAAMGSGRPSANFTYFGMAPDRLAVAADFPAGRNRGGCNTYVGVNPRKPGTNTRMAATAQEVEIAFRHFADLDQPDAVALARERVAAARPTFIVTIGTVPHKRPHFYWLLEKPVRDLAAWTERQLGVQQALGGDSVIDPPRIMRLAGTVNWPTESKIARGYRLECVTMRTRFADER
jgi:hypothetical protein